MFSFSAQTLLIACNNLNNCPAQVGGIISIISILDSSVNPLITYSINNKKLKIKLSKVFDKTPKTDFTEAEAKYIIFSNNWESHFFDNVIKEKIDLLSMSIFFLRRHTFSTKLSNDEIIQLFLKENNISSIMQEIWFTQKNDFVIEYNENDVEKNQEDFYEKRFKNLDFKSMTFNSIIQKFAYEFSAAAHIQTLYSGNEIKKCFIYSDESLSNYYNFNSSQKKIAQDVPFSHNRVIFGAPGTGKSFQLNKDLKVETGASYFIYYERVTFHPSYSYANFVGTYKPIKDEKGDGQITYKFVEGPFIRVLRQALCDTEGNNYLLIIEEINRANVTAVFGDIFQLLDRDSDNFSQYQVAASEDLRKHLIKHGVPEDKAIELRIPSNMYIWATMNSADQGVQPLDTAFKRRWEFEYLNINNSEEKIDVNMKNICFPNQPMDWNLLRHLINNRLISNYNINEDKLIGPFFIRRGNETDEQFFKSFKSKVLMYLFEDVCKINPKPLFAGINETKLYFSNIVSSFEKDGIKIFNFSKEEMDKAKAEIEKIGV